MARARRGSWFWLALLFALFAIFSQAALAAEESAKGASEFLLIVQIMLLIGLGRGLGEIMQRLGQPSIIGELLAGVLLGPSVFGSIWPDAQHAVFPSSPEQKALIDGIAQFGILLLLLLTGMETDLKLVKKVGRAAFAVSISGVVVPFACGFALGQFLPESLLPHPSQRMIASLFLGTALSISSVKIVAVVVREMKFMRRNVGQIIIASAVIDDTIGWIIIAIIFSLASQGTLDLSSLAKSVLGTLAFLGISLTLGRRFVFHLIRWSNDSLLSSAAVITVIMLLMGGMALITHAIGVHTVLGAFVAGVLVGESPILTRQIDERLRGLITSLFMPVFFGLAGLSADLTVLKNPSLLALTVVVVIIASIGKFGGAFIGGKLGGLTRMESAAIASGMNARGSTEVIIATIGLSMGVLSKDLFTIIVTMAIVTTMAMPPMLRAALARLPIGPDEKARLEKEEFEAKGFVARLERFLLAVDESANGKFAARLVGLLAGARGIPTTVLHLGRRAKEQSDKRDDAESPENTLKSAAQETARQEQQREGDTRDEVTVTTRAKEANAKLAVAEEAQKGFDLLVVGLDEILDTHGDFHKNVQDAVGGFDGPIALVMAKGKHLESPSLGGFSILIPVTRTSYSQRGAELAVALARASSAPLRAIYVAQGDSRRTVSVTNFEEEAILRSVVELAERYDVAISTNVRTGIAPAEAIIQEARSSRSDVIVMGVERSSGDIVHFGETARAIMKKAKVSLMFVSG